MPDKFLTSVITDLARLQIRIDSIPNRTLRREFEKEFEAKRFDLINSFPDKLKHKIDEMIDEEIKRISREKSSADSD